MSWETWSFAFNVTVPNLLMMLLGILLRHWRLMDDRFCRRRDPPGVQSGAAVPAVSASPPTTRSCSATCRWCCSARSARWRPSCSWSWRPSGWWKEPRERGVFVQGGFRANTAIVGLAYAMTAYGSEGIALASLYLTVTVILFNVLSVIT